MLLGNYSVLNRLPLRSLTGALQAQLRSNFNTSGSVRNRFYIDQSATALSLYAAPTGYYPSYTWIIPQKAGEIGSTAQILSTGGVTGSGALGLAAQASLTGDGDITSATGQLVISMLATITGAGSVSSADAKAFLNALATLAGGGGITADVSALAWAVASVSGSGNITAALLRALGSMAADIRGYSSLTPEGLRDAVWGAVAAANSSSGSMGEKLNSAASGGVDYAALGAAVWGILQADADTPDSMGARLLEALSTSNFLALK